MYYKRCIVNGADDGRADTVEKPAREIRTDLPTKRTARVLLCLYREHLVALHGFIKKAAAKPDEDLALARKRRKELTR
jgi:phage-related protein